STPSDNETCRSDHSTFNQISPSFDLIAINCKSSGKPIDAAPNPMICGIQGVSDGVRGLLSQSLSPATRRAYRSDMAHYEAWGGNIPSIPEEVAEYLAGLAETHTVATISRRL